MKFGIIGYGRMGKVYRDVLSSMNIHLEFICDTIDTNAEKNIQFFPNFKDALDKSKVDGIIISTYGPSHYEIIMYALEKEIPYIVCEKPFTTSVIHADKIIEKLRSSKTRLTVNYSRRFSEVYSNLKKDLYQKNIIGNPRTVMISCGAGGLSAYGTHLFDLCSFLLDSKVSSLHAIPVDKNLPNPRGEKFKDPGGYILFIFENGSRAFLDLGDDLGLQPLIELVGEYGRCLIDDLNKTITVRGRSEEDREKPNNFYGLPNPIIKNDSFDIGTMNEMITNLMKNLISADTLTVTPEMAKHKVEIYSAIRKSFDTKETVSLPLKDDYYEKEFMVT